MDVAVSVQPRTAQARVEAALAPMCAVCATEGGSMCMAAAAVRERTAQETVEAALDPMHVGSAMVEG